MRSASRLRRNVEKQSRKQLIFSTVGIIVILFMLLKFGSIVVAGISGVFIRFNEASNNSDELKTNFTIRRPILDDLPSATNSASVIIAGLSDETNEGYIEIYLNGLSKEEIKIENDKSFEITLSGLREGENTIKARFKTTDDKLSEFSDEQLIRYSLDEPKIEVSFPSESQEFKKGDEQINIQGKTEPPDNSVTVNGFRSIVDDEGNFSYYLKLNDGENTISIEAESLSGVKTKKEIKVRYSP